MGAFVEFTKASTALGGLATCGLAQLGTSTIVVGNLEIDIDYVPREFKVYTAWEGPQILLSWKSPTILASYDVRLERSAWTFPKKFYDGKVIFEGTISGDYKMSDMEDMVSNKGYYYTLFVKDPGTNFYFTHSTLQASAVAYKTGYFKDKLFNLLPSIYRSIDARPDLGGLFGQYVLEETTGTADQEHLNEIFNFNESQTKKQGQLQRFLKLFGLVLDETRQLTSRYSDNMNIDEVESKFLQFLASNIGLELNKELSVARQRKELTNYAYFHKFKGTENSFKSQFAAITGNANLDVHSSSDSLLKVSTFKKKYGTQHIARDLVGLRNNTPLGNDIKSTASKNTSSANVSDRVSLPLTQRPKALYFRTKNGSLKTGGFVEYTIDGFVSTSNSVNQAKNKSKRWKALITPGQFTVECWLKFLKFPVYVASDVPASDTQIKYRLAWCTVDYLSGASNRKLIYEIALVTLVSSTDGSISHQLQVNYNGLGPGSAISTITLFTVPVGSGDLSLNKPIHIAATKTFSQGPGMINGHSLTEAPKYGNNNPSNLAHWTLFINGEQKSTNTGYGISNFAGTLPFKATVNNPNDFTGAFFDVMYLGDYTSDDHGVLWVIDEFRLWDKAKSEDEISRDFNKAVDPLAKNLVVYSPFEYEGELPYSATTPDNVIAGINAVPDLSSPAGKTTDINGFPQDWDDYSKFEGIFAYGSGTFDAGTKYLAGPPVYVDGLMANPFNEPYEHDDEMRRREEKDYLKESYTLSLDYHPKLIKFKVDPSQRISIPSKA